MSSHLVWLLNLALLQALHGALALPRQLLHGAGEATHLLGEVVPRVGHVASCFSYRPQAAHCFGR